VESLPGERSWSHQRPYSGGGRLQSAAMGGSRQDVRFPARELAARLARVRAQMEAEEMDACVVLAPESQLWLCGLESFISGVLTQALIVPADDRDEMSLVVWDADLPLARATSIVDDVRTYRFGVDDPVAAIRTAVAERVRGAGVVGIDAGSRAVPYALGLALVAALAPARCVDCSELLAGARLVKSQLELDCLRRAGGYAEAGLRPALAHARPGISERELAAEIEYAMRRAGSDYPSIPTELASGPRSVLVHGTPGHRLLEPGDLVHVEIGGVEARYTAVGLQTFHVGGAPPPPVGVHLYGVAQACLRTGLDAIRPGIEAPAIEAPALAILRDAGLGEGFMMRFGYGVGVGFPPTWLDPLQITRTSKQALAPGTTFVLHACLLDEQAQVGVVVGGTYAVGEAGVETLAGAGPVELVTT
jgi:Xaa-Pro aminopeptidase